MKMDILWEFPPGRYVKIGAKAIMVLRFCPEIVDEIMYAREFLADCFGGV
ncbi:MAG: hypothetical protein U5N58_10560 [Actinomycetota bacterium]|nr:hypothetical protein [Actinomycetota bacterium]